MNNNPVRHWKIATQHLLQYWKELELAIGAKDKSILFWTCDLQELYPVHKSGYHLVLFRFMQQQK